MSEDNLQKIIISTIREEKHLGENLKQQCIEYIEDLQQRLDNAIEYNYIVSNSDYVYSQDEIANKNISILKGKEVKDYDGIQLISGFEIESVIGVSNE